MEPTWTRWRARGNLSIHPGLGQNMENVNTQMTVIPKKTTTARIKAEMEPDHRGGRIRGVRQSVHRWIADGGPSRVRNYL
jgi:hypothetical protein